LPVAVTRLLEFQIKLVVGDLGGDPMFPHIAMMQALRRHEPKAPPAPRRKAAKVYKVVR
jgi:hypothetical protein